MDTIDEFLEIDQDNIIETKRVLKEIHPKSLIAVEECSNLLQEIAETFGQKYLFDEYQKIFKDWIDEFKVPLEDAFNLFKKAQILNFNQNSNDSTSDAKMALEKIYSTMSRTYLLLRIRRDFFLGMAEIFRLRYTTALAYHRLQSETFALIKLFGDKPSIAQEWMNATTNDLGFEFFKRYRKQIKNILEITDLYNDYNTSSGLSMHSRILGIASGLIIGNKMREYGKPKEAVLVYNEIDDHVSLFIWFTKYLDFHKKLAYNLAKNIQEFDKNDLNNISLKRYADLVTELSERLKQLKTKSN